MKFSVPTNWQQDLIQNLKKDYVDELYGKLQDDFIGGLRNPYSLPNVSKKRVKFYVREIHKKDLKFNYILNSICLGNLEWTRFGQKRLQYFLGWLIDIGIDSVTVAIPYILELIKKRYPFIKVTVSTVALVDSIEKAKYWEDLGADEITLSSISVNRNFLLLKKIRGAVKCQLRLIANECCLYNCPFIIYHGTSSSHAAQSQNFLKGFVFDYSILACNYRKIKNPLEFIRSPWIRPEDVRYYEEIGINKIKLVDRTMPTESILRIVNAYVNRRYDGNLMDLFPGITKSIMFAKPHLFHKFKYFCHPFLINIFKFAKIKELIFPDIYIDNRGLDNFIQYFLSRDCSRISCIECGYCQEIANKVIRINKASQLAIIKRYQEYFDELFTGKLFRYVP